MSMQDLGLTYDEQPGAGVGFVHSGVTWKEVDAVSSLGLKLSFPI